MVWALDFEVDLIFCLSVKGVLTRQHAEGDNTECPYIHLIIVFSLTHDLWRHIQRCAKWHTHSFTLRETCKAEISDLASHARCLTLLRYVHHYVLQL